MRRVNRLIMIVALLALSPAVSGCSNFDMDKLDIFGLNEKKKLPGDRRALFPEGVPGVSQGVPPELIKGHQPPVEELPPPVVQPQAEPQRPRPKPRVVQRPPRVTVQPSGEPAAQPAPAPQSAPSANQTAPWPEPQPSGTFRR